jgi:hypothetical protein
MAWGLGLETWILEFNFMIAKANYQYSSTCYASIHR